MTAPLVKRLEEKISAATDIGSRGELLAHLGCYYAKAGELEASTALCKELRDVYGDGRYPRVSILIMCMEAIQLYFREQTPASQDRIKRANVLSLAIRDRELIALTAAWKAFLHFNFDEYSEVGYSLRLAFENSTQEDLLARLRSAIVLADSANLTRQFEAAKKWYAIARDLSVSLGDQAAMGAVTYNRPAFGVYTARVSKALGILSDDEYPLLKVEVESAVNYQAVARLRSLDHLLGVARSGLLMLQENYVEALPEIETLLENSDLKLTPNDAAVLNMDRVAATAAPTVREDAIRLLQDDGYRAALDLSDAGDKIIVLTQAKKIIGELNDALPGFNYSEKLEVARAEYGKKMEELKEAIRPYL